MLRWVALAGAVTLVFGCGGGDGETLRRLESAKADSARDSSRVADSVRRDSSRTTSDLRLRVRDRDVLDPSKVRKAPKQ
jgi:hypothetical protein